MVVAMMLQQTKEPIMAKSRQQNSIEQAIMAVTGALKIDAIANPTDEQKKQRETAMLNAANVIETSGIITMAQHGDDNIETAHQVDAEFEQAGINPVQFRRDAAVAGAAATVAAIEAGEQAGELEAGEQTE